MKTNLHNMVFPIIAACLCPIAASGEIVTFDFTGGVSSVYNPFAVVSPSLVQVGDPVQVSLRFDTATPDGYSEANRGMFVGPGWLKVGINGLNFERTTSIQIDILHGANGGQELFQVLVLGSPTAWPEVLPTYPYQRILLGFWETGPPYDFLSSADLPTALDFSRADIRGGSVATATDTLNMYEIQFTLVQVPEPATASLLAGGLLLWWWVYQARVARSGAVKQNRRKTVLSC
jgi:hypothetical protein